MELDSRKEKAEVPQKCVWVGGCAGVALEGRRKDIEAEEAIIDRRKKHQSTPSQHQSALWYLKTEKKTYHHFYFHELKSPALSSTQEDTRNT